MALKENSIKVLNYVREHQAENITAADIAEGTGLEVKSVNGIVTSAFQRKGLMERVEAEIEVTDGDKVSHKQVKFIRLTPEGEAFDENSSEN